MKRAGIAGILAFTACFGGALETAQANEPATISGGQNAPSVVASRDPLPSYFKTGILDFASRVWAQTQIERVFYNHRIWPKENPGSKPPFEQMVPAVKIQAIVIDLLKPRAASINAGASAITSAMLQTEMDRIAKSTKDPILLSELFSALKDDPFLIAESLARQTLVNRAGLAHTADESGDSADVDERDAAIKSRITVKSIDFRLPNIAPANGCTSFATIAAGEPEARSRLTMVWTGSEMIAWGGVNYPQANLNNGGRYSPSTDTWTPTSVGLNTPVGRWGHSAVWTGSEMIIWGGYGTGVGQTGGMYDPVNDQWTQTSIMAGTPSARGGHVAVWTGTRMIVWGGGYNTGGRYDPASDTWTATSTAGIQPRSSNTVIWTGSDMIVWGGVDGTGDRYAFATDTWLHIAANPYIGSRTGHTAVWTGSEMIIWGGLQGGAVMNDGARYQPASGLWLPLVNPAGTVAVRFGHTAVWTGTEMIVWGGIPDLASFPAGLNSGGRYNPATGGWTATGIATDTPQGRYEHGAVWTGTEMIIWGGRQNGIYYLKSGRYTPGTDTWKTTPPGIYTADKRSRAAAVWTGAEFLVWGGWFNDIDYNLFLADGARYTPALDQWEPLPTAGGPTVGREFPSSVWTGTEMIVWGGDYNWPSPPLYTGTGGRYNPATRQWQMLSTGAGAPFSRSNHSAVWTGTEMLIWGGMYSTGGTNYFLQSGARYNPSSDTWQAIPTSAAPAGRAYHTAVWTGTYMMVWGGNANGAYLGTGGRYDPVQNLWLPVSGVNAPEARTDHTAVWTGGYVIEWGGLGYFSALNNGGRYDPITDSWLSMNTGVDVPAAMSDTPAVWTGTRMIIWNGGAGAGASQYGGIYDPGTDAWKPLSITGDSAAGRSFHDAAWTGTTLIVVGGLNAVSQNPSGVAYTPALGITTQPVASSTCLDSSASFSATACGDEPGYLWRLNGTPINDGPVYTGTRSSALSISAAPAGVFGSYDVQVIDEIGGRTLVSAPASLSQIAPQPPTFSGLQSAGSPGGTTCQIHLTWQPGIPGACSSAIAYDMYRSQNPVFTPSLQNLIARGVAGSAYDDYSALVYGATYYYIARAVNDRLLEDGNTVTRAGVPNGSPSAPQTVIENFEGALSGGGFDNAGWTHAAVTGAKDWAWSASQVKSPTHSWWSQSLAAASDRVLASPAYKMTASSSLTFWHTYYFDYNISLDTCKDGGTLEISTNGGASWAEVPPAALSAGGYTGVITPAANPLNGKDAWCGGAIGPMTQVTANLSAYNGLTAQLRWHEGDDGAIARTGWYVDSVTFNNIQASSACATCNVTAMQPVRINKSAADLHIGWPGLIGVTIFNIYRSASGPAPYSWGIAVGTAAGTAVSWSDSGQLGVPGSRFYTVTDVNACGAESLQ